jgi:hypothetical protein
MLDPAIRQIYIDQLNPPEGYRLRRAIGATFSLDLMSLLMVPISMTMADYKLQCTAANDPVAVIEALHRSADRLIIFCQKGRIAIPSRDTLLYSYLEKVVIEARALNKDGVFHPKTWLLKFVEEKKDDPGVIYRFLCLSRNLTFDHSWDTVLVLEGYLNAGRQRGFGLNRPLGQFIGSLPDLADKRLSGQIRKTVLEMADEVTRVRFDPPDDFERIHQFIPIGIPGYVRFPKIPSHKRNLIVSPFLSGNTIKQLIDTGSENLVISRPEALDGLSTTARHFVTKNAEVYILNEAAEKPEASTQEHSEFSGLMETEDCSGLHAKLIITENGSRATVFTGSANVTEAAFSGKNVEFAVALAGQRRMVGIDSFLGDEKASMSFASMLIPYRNIQCPEKKDDLKAELEKVLEEARSTLLKTSLQLSILPSDPGTYSMALSCQSAHLSLPAHISCSCYPITIREGHSKDLNELEKDGKIEFRLTAEALTSFIAFKMIAKISGENAGLSFVCNLPVTGMPNDRDKHVLHTILSDKETFIRYLLLILGSDDLSEMIRETRRRGGPKGRSGAYLLPLFEELVRAYSRNPEKIDRISRIIQDLKEVGNLDDVLPEGFEDIWSAFMGKSIQE